MPGVLVRLVCLSSTKSYRGVVKQQLCVTEAAGMASAFFFYLKRVKKDAPSFQRTSFLISDLVNIKFAVCSLTLPRIVIQPQAQWW